MSDADRTDKPVLIGVVSDTHGHFHPGIPRIFKGMDQIIHAGDFNTPEIFEKFRGLAPLKAVRGNTDHHADLHRLPKTTVLQVEEVFIYVVHDLTDMEIDPAAAGFQVVVHGHLHVPEIKRRDGVLYLNPGSPSSPRRGSHPGVARLRILNRQVEADLLTFSD